MGLRQLWGSAASGSVRHQNQLELYIGKFVVLTHKIVGKHELHSGEKEVPTRISHLTDELSLLNKADKKEDCVLSYYNKGIHCVISCIFALLESDRSYESAWVWGQPD